MRIQIQVILPLDALILLLILKEIKNFVSESFRFPRQISSAFFIYSILYACKFYMFVE